MKQPATPWPLIIVPLIVAALSVPMALDMVGPNSFYGVRTAATRASEADWYRANRAAGQVGIAAAAIGFAAMIAVFRSAVPSARKHFIGVGIVAAIAAAIAITAAVTG